jgi:hypothetical protein
MVTADMRGYSCEIATSFRLRSKTKTPLNCKEYRAMIPLGIGCIPLPSGCL